MPLIADLRISAGRALGVCVGSYAIAIVAASLVAARVLAAAGADMRIVQAAKRGDRLVVQALIDSRADVNGSDLEGATAAHWAAENDDAETMDLLIRAGAKVGAANRLGVQPITLAARNGNAAMLEKLLRAGVDPNTVAGQGETALMTAARTGRADAVRVLLDWGADANASEDWRGQTALMWAVAERHTAAAQVLLEYGTDVDARSKAGNTALFFAVRKGDQASVQLLMTAGADLKALTPEGMSPLVVAITNAHWDLATWLLDQGANPNAAAPGATPLHVAIRTRDPETVALPDPTPTGDSLDFLRALIAHGADVNAPLAKGQTSTFLNLTGATPFLLAAHSVDVPVMRLLVEHGADPLAPTRDKSTPLMAAGPYQPVWMRSPRDATTWATSRIRGRVSSTHRPSEEAIVSRCIESPYTPTTWPLP